MTKEIWTVKFEVDLDQFDSIWEHMKNKEAMAINSNTDNGIREIMEDGIHFHYQMHCTKEFDWRLIKREPLNKKEI